MQKKYNKIIGIILFLAGVILILNSILGLTGYVILKDIKTSLSGIFGLIFIISGVILFVSKGLERRVMGEEHTVISAQKLKSRLKFMQDYELIGVNQQEVPIGRYLKPIELKKIKEIILKYIPKDLIKNESEIAVSGSLSRKRKGQRKTRWDVEMGSDQFYLSDIDVEISGSNLFDYLRANWDSSIYKDGKFKNKVSYKVTEDRFLDRREKKRGYMGEAPDWIINMVKELNSYSFAGEHRPINVKFFNNLKLTENIPRDILYHKS